MDLFKPSKVGNKNPEDVSTFGNLSMRFDYVVKGLTVDDLYPPEAVTPWLHYNMRVGNLRADGEVESQFGLHRLSNKKNFDIPHPNKPGWRLRHTCLEGPENAVYFRGRLKENNVIELPDYWKNFVDYESITVSLTQIGSSQDLIVDKIESESKIFIRSGNKSTIDCYYMIHAERKDGEKLIPEYQGQGPQDYPGNNDEYSVAGYHYDTKDGVIK